jgi:hypothetical protein
MDSWLRYAQVDTLGLGTAFLGFGFALTFVFAFVFVLTLGFAFVFGSALPRPVVLEDEALAFALPARKREGEVESARYANEADTKGGRWIATGAVDLNATKGTRSAMDRVKASIVAVNMVVDDKYIRILPTLDPQSQTCTNIPTRLVIEVQFTA